MMMRDPAVEYRGRSILFMDLDGVANGHERHGNGYCGTRKACVTRLNRVIRETDCLLVATSAWRYLVLNGHMTVVGLENLLLTHGLDCRERLLGIVRADLSADQTDRGQQILEFGVAIRVHERSTGWAVVDDLDLGISMIAPDRFVQTDRWEGLTDADAGRLIRMLGLSARLPDGCEKHKERQWRRV